MAGVSCGNARAWIGVFEGNGGDNGDNGDNGEGTVRFSQMWAEAISRAMLQCVQTKQKAYDLSSQVIQLSRRPGHPPESKGGSRNSTVFVAMTVVRLSSV